MKKNNLCDDQDRQGDDEALNSLVSVYVDLMGKRIDYYMQFFNKIFYGVSIFGKTKQKIDLKIAEDVFRIWVFIMDESGFADYINRSGANPYFLAMFDPILADKLNVPAPNYIHWRLFAEKFDNQDDKGINPMIIFYEIYSYYDKDFTPVKDKNMVLDAFCMMGSEIYGDSMLSAIIRNNA